MKKLLFYVSTLIILFSLNGYSNTRNFSSSDDLYNKTMLGLVRKLMDSVKTIDDFKNLANDFERIAITSKDKWLPYYYSSFCWTTVAGLDQNTGNVDKFCDKAEELIDSAKILSPNNSEILCVMALINSSRIRVDFKSRGMKYVSISNDLLKKALQMDKDNPRAYYLLGRNMLGTPEAFGGGKDNAKKYFLLAKTKYEGKKISTDSFEPQWGKRPNLEILKTTYNE